MAVKVPSQSEIEQFFYNIDELEGYSFDEWLDYMEQEYPNVDAVELYTSKGENIVTGYRDESGAFVKGAAEVPEGWERDDSYDGLRKIDEVDPAVQATVDKSLEGFQSGLTLDIQDEATMLDAEPMTDGEKAAAFMDTLRTKYLENNSLRERVASGVGDGMRIASDKGVALQEQFGTDVIPEAEYVASTEMSDGGVPGMLSLQRDQMLAQENGGLRPELFPGDTIIEDMIASAATTMELPYWAAAIIGAVVTKKPPKKLTNNKLDVAPNSKGMVSSTKAKELVNPGKPKMDSVMDKLGPAGKVMDAKQARQAALLGNVEKVKTVIATGARPKGKGFTQIDKKVDVPKLAVAGTGAVAAATTYDRMLGGDRDADGTLKTAPARPKGKGFTQIDKDVVPEVNIPEVDVEAVTSNSGLIADMPPYEKSIDNRDIGGKSGVVSTRPGWKLPQEFEGSTNEGNYLSADFEDEHWNTAAGVNEAIGIWGRPIGTRSSGPTTAYVGNLNLGEILGGNYSSVKSGQSPAQSMKQMKKYGAGSARNWK